MVQRWGETWSEDHPHSERTGAIIAAAIRVQKAQSSRMPTKPVSPMPCAWMATRRSGKSGSTSLVVEDKVLVEAKTVERLVDVHYAQVNSYLRFSGLELALLLNFRTWPLKDGGIRRVIRSNT